MRPWRASGDITTVDGPARMASERPCIEPTIAGPEGGGRRGILKESESFSVPSERGWFEGGTVRPGGKFGEDIDERQRRLGRCNIVADRQRQIGQPCDCSPLPPPIEVTPVGKTRIDPWVWDATASRLVDRRITGSWSFADWGTEKRRPSETILLTSGSSRHSPQHALSGFGGRGLRLGLSLSLSFIIGISGPLSTALYAFDDRRRR